MIDDQIRATTVTEHCAAWTGAVQAGNAIGVAVVRFASFEVRAPTRLGAVRFEQLLRDLLLRDLLRDLLWRLLGNPVAMRICLSNMSCCSCCCCCCRRCC